MTKINSNEKQQNEISLKYFNDEFLLTLDEHLQNREKEIIKTKSIIESNYNTKKDSLEEIQNWSKNIAQKLHEFIENEKFCSYIKEYLSAGNDDYEHTSFGQDRYYPHKKIFNRNNFSLRLYAKNIALKIEKDTCNLGKDGNITRGSGLNTREMGSLGIVLKYYSIPLEEFEQSVVENMTRIFKTNISETYLLEKFLLERKISNSASKYISSFYNKSE